MNSSLLIRSFFIALVVTVTLGLGFAALTSVGGHCTGGDPFTTGIHVYNCGFVGSFKQSVGLVFSLGIFLLGPLFAALWVGLVWAGIIKNRIQLQNNQSLTVKGYYLFVTFAFLNLLFLILSSFFFGFGQKRARAVIFLVLGVCNLIISIIFDRNKGVRGQVVASIIVSLISIYFGYINFITL